MNASDGPTGDGPTTASIESAKAGLVAARAPLLRRTAMEIAEVLGAVGARFTTMGDPLRNAALERLPDEAALPSEMAAIVLDRMAADWTVERLRTLLSADFEDPTCLDRPVTVRGRRIMAFGPERCVQISSGSVPGVGVNALIRSLLVKAPTLIKPGGGDRALTELYAEALLAHDTELGSALAVRYWPGDSEDLTRAAIGGADVVVAYGADASVDAIRTMVPVTTRFVPYHHRFGVGLVGREALGEGPSEASEGSGVRAVAADVARAVALFEHRGCVCPHVIYVEEGGACTPEAFAELVATSLSGLEAEWPSGEPGAARTAATAAALQQARGTVEIQAAAGAARLFQGGAANWTVVFESRLVPAPELPGRSVRIRAVDDLERVPELLSGAGPHLQSVGFAGLGDRLTDVASALGRIGASRVVPFERMSFPPPWWLHDGRGPLATLVRWLEVESQR